MPELDELMAIWRVEISRALPHQSETVRELEEHLRDAVMAAMDAGAPLREAFPAAVARLGPPDVIEAEFARIRSRWFCGVQGRELRLLAHAGGVMGWAIMSLYAWHGGRAAVELWSRGRSSSHLGYTLYLEVLAVTLMALGGIAIGACRRVLRAPNSRDARTVVAFSLLVVWMLTADFLNKTAYPVELRVGLMAMTILPLGALWWNWRPHITLRSNSWSSGAVRF